MQAPLCLALLLPLPSFPFRSHNKHTRSRRGEGKTGRVELFETCSSFSPSFSHSVPTSMCLLAFLNRSSAFRRITAHLIRVCAWQFRSAPSVHIIAPEAHGYLLWGVIRQTDRWNVCPSLKRTARNTSRAVRGAARRQQRH